MKRLFSLLTLATISTAAAVNETPPHSQTLNQQMTITDQKATGVHELDKTQRENLETWLQNKSLQTRPQKNHLEDQTVTNSTLSLNIDGGAFIQLYDGSVWEIDPKHRSVTENWISPVQITVEIEPGNDWPFKIINQSNNEIVYARRSNLNYAASLPTIKATPSAAKENPSSVRGLHPPKPKAPPELQTSTPSQRNSQ